MQPTQPDLRPEDKNWGMLAHLLTLLGYVVLFGHWIPPLVIYLTKKGDSAFASGRRASRSTSRSRSSWRSCSRCRSCVW